MALGVMFTSHAYVSVIFNIQYTVNEGELARKNYD